MVCAVSTLCRKRLDAPIMTRRHPSRVPSGASRADDGVASRHMPGVAPLPCRKVGGRRERDHPVSRAFVINRALLMPPSRRARPVAFV